MNGKLAWIYRERFDSDDPWGDWEFSLSEPDVYSDREVKMIVYFEVEP